jgi:hypothetical protein
MKPRYFVMFAGLILIAYSMTSCATTTVKLPDGSETTTTAPDPIFWGMATDAAATVAVERIHAEK